VQKREGAGERAAAREGCEHASPGADRLCGSRGAQCAAGRAQRALRRRGAAAAGSGQRPPALLPPIANLLRAGAVHAVRPLLLALRRLRLGGTRRRRGVGGLRLCGRELRLGWGERQAAGAGAAAAAAALLALAVLLVGAHVRHGCGCRAAPGARRSCERARETGNGGRRRGLPIAGSARSRAVRARCCSAPLLPTNCCWLRRVKRWVERTGGEKPG
jgi:hypothetical protein